MTEMGVWTKRTRGPDCIGGFAREGSLTIGCVLILLGVFTNPRGREMRRPWRCMGWEKVVET